MAMFTEHSDAAGGSCGGALAAALPAAAPPPRRPARVRASHERAARVIALRSHRLLRLFGALCAHDLASFFDGTRLLGELPAVDGPLVLFANHPSWWDAELFGWLATTVFADRRSFVPMDARNLSRYRILERFGVFPVQLGSFAGASDFLATAEEILRLPDGLLCVNIEGCFRDVRARPVRPMPGLAHLARRVPTATFIPLAMDYVFWSERRPNLLLAFGEPVRASDLAALPPGAASQWFAGALEGLMSDLSIAGQSRNPARFRTLLKGRDGTNFLFDVWRRMTALMAGQRFVAAHRVGHGG